MRKYCSKCNSPTDYSDSLPAFCAHCGNPFAGTTAAKIQIEHTVLRRKAIAKQELEEYEDDQEEERPDSTTFSTPEIEVDIPERQIGKMADLVTSRAKKQQIIRPKLKKMNKKQIIENFKNEINKNTKNTSPEILIGGMGGE